MSKGTSKGEKKQDSWELEEKFGRDLKSHRVKYCQLKR